MHLDLRTFRVAGAPMIRAALHTPAALPAWPDLPTNTTAHPRAWRRWIRLVWPGSEYATAIRHASPTLAARLDAIATETITDPRKLTAAGLSLVRYMARLAGRATPFGLLAGVAPAHCAPELTAHVGTAHRAVARAGAGWLHGIIMTLETDPTMRQRLMVVTNTAAFTRGDRVVVPFAAMSRLARPGSSMEVSIRDTAAVRLILDLAQAPVHWSVLAGKLAAEFPTVDPERVDVLLTDLLHHNVLLSSLHAPATTIDPLGHLLAELTAASADEIRALRELVRELEAIQIGIATHNRADYAAAAVAQEDLTRRMVAVRADDRPLAIDVQLDAEVTVPPAVLREAANGAAVLAHLSAYPFGAPSWQQYLQRFFERYGIGSLVPLLDLVDPDAGLGLPDGYLTTDTASPAIATSPRDRGLLALAQTAALHQLAEVALTPSLVKELALDGIDEAQLPRHLEVGFELHAASLAAVRAGNFAVSLASVSRAAGTLTGRFLHLLGPEHSNQLATVLATDPSRRTTHEIPVQVSVPPLLATAAHVARVPQVLPDLVSIAEHRPEVPTVLEPADLTVATNGHRLYLASLSRRQWIEPLTLNALDLRAHTPALARFITEITRAQTAIVSTFDWGAASQLPFLPRLRAGRTIISPARWRLTNSDFPDALNPRSWGRALAAIRDRRRIPTTVLLTRGDQRLPLTLTEIAHAEVLRVDLLREGAATLTEAPGNDAYGWIDGRAHEIVTPLVAARPADWPAIPAPEPWRVLTRDHGHQPGTSDWVSVKLYGHPARQPEILTLHLPALLEQLPDRAWWFIPYRDPRPHLRLRIALSHAAQTGTVLAAISTWVAGLRRAGLVSDLHVAPYYPETGRWGRGPATEVAERVFAADSLALTTQHAEAHGLDRQVLAAANFVSIATTFTASSGAGMRWLHEHANVPLDKAPARELLATATRLANPDNGWAALRNTPGGDALTGTWANRDQALRAYRTTVDATGLDVDEALRSLLHVHYIRAGGRELADERTCLRLARAAAHTWIATRGDQL